MTKKEIISIRRTVTKDDNPTKANDSQPPKPPLSPPTSPPLAVSSSLFNPILNGNAISDTLSTNPLSVGSLGYVATLPPREWFKLLVASLPSYAFTASNVSRKVLYSRKRDISSKEAERIQQNEVKVVGFDLEWKPMRDWGREYNKVSLVQIATADEILLVQLPESSSISNTIPVLPMDAKDRANEALPPSPEFPSGLQALLEDPTILKVGAGIQNDVDKLKRDWKVNVQNYLDLAFLARYHDYFWDTCDVLNNHCINGAFGGAWCDGTGTDAVATHAASTPSSTPTPGVDSRSEPGHDPPAQIHVPLEQLHGRPVYPSTQPVALARLVARYLGRRLDKECQLSNWAAPLSEKQIEYAANDGCSSLDVYNTLIRLRDHTPGWAEAQAMFYRMVIEYHRTLTTPTSPLQPVFLKPSTSATPEDEETVFAMEGDEPRATESSPTRRSLHLNSTPSLYRSLSDPHIIKATGEILLGNNGASKKGSGSHPLYPSPPVTPTRTSVLPAPSSSAPRSAPASPILVARHSLQEPVGNAGPINTVKSSQALDAPTHKTSRWNSRKLKQREIYSISHPNSLSYGSKRGSTGSELERARRLSDGTLATAMQQNSAPVPAPIPPNTYYGEYPGVRPARPSPVHDNAIMHGATPSNGYLPPTPATPYSSQNSYVVPGYHGVSMSYPQHTSVPHAYSYPTAVPYAYPAYQTYAQHAYPYAHPHPHPRQAQPHGYYYWPQDPVSHGYWSAQNSSSSQASSSDLPAKRPLLRYSDGRWHNVEPPVSAFASAVEATRAGADAWVIPTPHGIPTPQLEADVRTEESEEADVDPSGWVSGDHAESDQYESPADEEECSAPQVVYVGDVALQSELYSDNVRFNSVTGSVSLGGRGNADDEEAPPLVPEIYA